MLEGQKSKCPGPNNSGSRPIPRISARIAFLAPSQRPIPQPVKFSQWAVSPRNLSEKVPSSLCLSLNCAIRMR